MTIKAVMVGNACNCNINIQKAAVKGLLWVWSTPRQCSGFQNGMEHSVRPCVQTLEENNNYQINNAMYIFQRKKREHARTNRTAPLGRFPNSGKRSCIFSHVRFLGLLSQGTTCYNSALTSRNALSSILYSRSLKSDVCGIDCFSLKLWRLKLVILFILVPSSLEIPWFVGNFYLWSFCSVIFPAQICLCN